MFGRNSVHGKKAAFCRVLTTAGSSNGSSNTNKETTSTSSAERSELFAGGDTATVRPGRRPVTSTDDPLSVVEGGQAGSPDCSGSVDDEWSRQMDELDRLRPVVAFNGVDERLLVDSFTDLPDVIIEEEVDDVIDDKQTGVEQVTSVRRLTFTQSLFVELMHCAAK